tara:strand:+ start:2138 stop:3193 length:1056 start_codon:yes stop_codon:yes gene_type:complete
MLKYLLYMHIAFSVIICQENYRSVEQIESEWGDYTKFQRDEMISFCDFLFNEGYYERCLISSFQFLYRLPDDPIKPALLYLIARSYEQMGNYSLSKKYYNRVMDIEPKTSKAYKAANYRYLYCDLMQGNLQSVLNTTKNSSDPYYLMLRGYCYLKELEWENARATFISAEELFDDKHYSKLMIPLYQSIDNVSLIKQHSKMKVALSGLIFPGGGQLALKDKKNAQGIFASSFLLYSIYNLGSVEDNSGSIRFSSSPGTVVPTYNGVSQNFNLSKDVLSKVVFSESSLIKYTLPPIVFGSVLYISSLVKSFSDTEEKNKSLIKFYASSSLESTPPKMFLDFEEPSILNNNYK